MKPLSITAILLAVCAIAVPAHADEAEPVVRCVKVIPARTECVEREVVIPARTETRCTPVYANVEVPCFKVRRVPIYITRRVPIWGEVEVPVFRAQLTPVTREYCDPCTGCVRTVCSHDVRVVQCGTRLEPRITEYKQERIRCGWREERYQCGTRTERRLTGTRSETREVCPARTVTRTDRVTVPCRRVTVVPDGTTGAEPLSGTTEVLTESEYAAEAR